MSRLHIFKTQYILPEIETPVLTNYKGGTILERRWYEPDREGDFLKPHAYWDNPDNDGQEIADQEVTEWMYLPKEWSEVPNGR